MKAPPSSSPLSNTATRDRPLFTSSSVASGRVFGSWVPPATTLSKQSPGIRSASGLRKCCEISHALELCLKPRHRKVWRVISGPHYGSKQGRRQLADHRVRSARECGGRHSDHFATMVAGGGVIPRCSTIVLRPTCRTIAIRKEPSPCTTPPPVTSLAS